MKKVLFSSETEKFNITTIEEVAGNVVSSISVGPTGDGYMMVLEGQEAAVQRKKNQVDALNKIDRYSIRLLIRLVDYLIQQNVINPADFPATEKAIYTQLKAKYQNIGEW